MSICGIGISGISIRMGEGNGGNYFGNEFFDFNGDFFDNMFVLHRLVNEAMAIEGISTISQVMVWQGQHSCGGWSSLFVSRYKGHKGTNQKSPHFCQKICG